MLTQIILYNLFKNRQRVANFMQNTKIIAPFVKVK